MKSWIDSLVNEVPKFDQEFLKDFRPSDSWIGSVSYGSCTPRWFEIREIVRKLSEGVAYKADVFDGFGTAK